ncbi:unnamed protein product [Cyclocybe aegerita]|uniref:RNase H type-1 domain-containing protein n=1 Tax=Cyclocybe aegerita TaxID=1973307 RepID=A0A8S0Y0G4_CYCAE|nr:unnamed protein product [Cyclocybe aegerita]
MEHDLHCLSDHVPICTDLDIGPELPRSGQWTIKPGSEAEKSFISDILRDLVAVPVAAPATKEGIEALADAIATAFLDVWLAHSTESKPTKRSKSWWTDKCSETFGVYQLSRSSRICSNPALPCITSENPFESCWPWGRYFDRYERVHTLTESFEPFAPEARPGDRLLDRYADRLHFNKRDPTQDRRPYLDELIARARADPLTVLAATDGSVPQSNQYQATSAAIIYKGHRELKRTCYVSGRVTAPDAELNAISCAVRLAVKQANCQHIMVFTDSMGSAHRAVDPGMHSGQAFSLSVCRALQEWFEADDLRRITFIYVPSALRWDIHGEAHKYVTELKVRVGRRKTDNYPRFLGDIAAFMKYNPMAFGFNRDPSGVG